MAKIRKPPPPAILDHLLQRFRDGRLAVEDFTDLKHWLESEPDVPSGMWFKRFPKFTLAQRGRVPQDVSHSGNGA